MPSHKDSISNCLLTLSMPLKTSSSDTKLLLDNPRSEGTSPRYRYSKPIWKASGGIVFASFQTVVSGVTASFFEKYGERADNMNLCKFHCSEAAVRRISDVFGICRVSREVIWLASGCRGSVLFE